MAKTFLAVIVLLCFVFNWASNQAAEASTADDTPKLFSSDGIPEPTGTFKVSSLAELEKAVDAAKPGDRVVLADGTYSSAAPIAVNKQGTAEHPIVLSAKSIGGAEIAGVGSFAIGKDAAKAVEGRATQEGTATT